MGLFSLATLVAGLAYVAVHWRYGIQYTFSQHVARHTDGIVFYIVLFLSTLPPLVVSYFETLLSKFHLPLWSGMALAGAALAQILCTFFPERSPQLIRVHRALAGLSAGSLLIVMAGCALGAAPLEATVSRLSLGAMVIVAATALTRTGRRSALLLQAAYFGVFFIPITFMLIHSLA